MPNNCINYVSFRGDEENVKNFKHLLKQKIEESISKDEYVWGDISDGRGVYFEQEWDDNQEEHNHFVCISAWASEVQLFQTLSQMFNIDFCVQFEELGSYLVGCIYTTPSESLTLYLSDEQIGTAYDEEEDGWDLELLETLNVESARKAGLDVF